MCWNRSAVLHDPHVRHVRDPDGRDGCPAGATHRVRHAGRRRPGRRWHHNVSDTAHKVAHWANDHKAMIAGIAAGVVVAAACEALTAGAGTVGCAALGGAVDNMVEYGVGTPRDQWRFGGFAKAGVIGAATGALAGVAGKFL